MSEWKGYLPSDCLECKGILACYKALDCLECQKCGTKWRVLKYQPSKANGDTDE